MISDLFTVFEEHVLPDIQPQETPTETPQSAELFTVEEPKAPAVDEEALASRVAGMVLEALKKEQEGAGNGVSSDSSINN